MDPDCEANVDAVEANDDAVEVNDVINDGAEDDPVDIIRTQQKFYESFKSELSDKFSHGYCEVLNKEVLTNMIETTMMLYTKLNYKELVSFSELLWQQKKFTGSDNLKVSLLFVCCVFDSKGELTYPLNIKSKKFLIRPVYRIPKCYKNTEHQRGCCAIFIDEFGRIYPNWQRFIQKNKYGNCLIVAPKGGFYDASESDEVELDITYQKDGVCKYFDYTSAGASFGATGLILVGMIPAVTLAPAVIVGATITGNSIFSKPFNLTNSI